MLSVSIVILPHSFNYHPYTAKSGEYIDHPDVYTLYKMFEVYLHLDILLPCKTQYIEVDHTSLFKHDFFSAYFLQVMAPSLTSSPKLEPL